MGIQTTKISSKKDEQKDGNSAKTKSKMKTAAKTIITGITDKTKKDIRTNCQ